MRSRSRIMCIDRTITSWALTQTTKWFMASKRISRRFRVMKWQLMIWTKTTLFMGCSTRTLWALALVKLKMCKLCTLRWHKMWIGTRDQMILFKRSSPLISLSKKRKSHMRKGPILITSRALKPQMTRMIILKTTSNNLSFSSWASKNWTNLRRPSNQWTPQSTQTFSILISFKTKFLKKTLSF